ncbi:hypothetical protein G7074_02130 [Pedobacter sp. HDW13]|uniref:carboxypeptidase-like regulatory domain-containing protein n=1 Tax=Pedobacter sp. HDW13 TaxID=2714940 RepID=UPI00140AF824|nr:carboxypeptidase-like regulatory domain-containing protein [Pedobacter sp. HDW13]QIL38177.1 hypothetical protein G7074_02130 [Pedobacter sp. HDW13]
MLFFNAFYSHAQKAMNADSLLKNLDRYVAAHPQEKVHLHFDKPFYASGDDIWFKAYVLDATTLQPSTNSGTLYVELFDAQHIILQKRTLPMVNGISWGDFKLTDSLATGQYCIRAYTQLMRNMGADFFFEKTFAIASRIKTQKTEVVKQPPAAKDVLTLANEKPATDVQFVPEGGNLVAGLPSKIGYKAIGPNGLGVEVSGVILDRDNNEVTTLGKSYLGMGSFLFTPEANMDYRAQLKLPNGAVKLYPMPKVLPSGYGVMINNVDTANLKIKVLISADLLGKGDLFLLGQQNGNVAFSLPIASDSQLKVLNIAKDKLPAGVMQFTLFADQQPVCERITFIHPNQKEKLTLMVNGLKESYKTREATTLNLGVTNNGQPVQGSFSVSVTNTNVIKPDTVTGDNILTTMLLSADLRGHIEKANHYLENDDAETRVKLDNLLLIQGWRKINWKKLDSLSEPKFPAEKAIRISGTVTKKNQPLAKVKVILLRTGQLDIDETETDGQGHFAFNKMFVDTAKFVVRAKVASGQSFVAVKLDNIAPQLFTEKAQTTDTLFESSLRAGMHTYLNQTENFYQQQLKSTQKKDGIMLKEVNITQRRAFYFPNGQPVNTGNIVQTILPKDLKGYEDITDYLGNHVSGGAYLKNSERGVLRAYFMLGTNGGTPPFIEVELGTVVNDTYMDENFDLSRLPVNQIERIDNYISRAPLTAYMVIYMKDKTITYENYRKDTPPGMLTITKLGYSVNREFYSPKYEVKNNKQEPDLRTTLYWNPNLSPDKNGNIKIDYLNANQVGKHQILLEGMDSTGKLFHQVILYGLK